MTRNTIALALYAAIAVATPSTLLAQPAAQPAAGFDKLKALAGAWIDIDGSAHPPTFNLSRRKA